MPYIGKQPTIGEFVELDALTASATDTYTLTRNSAAYYPETVNNLLVSINGVIQAGSTMSLSGNTLTVGATLSSSDVIDFVRVFGNVGNVVTPTDGSVTSAKLDTNIAISGNLDVGSIRASNGTAAMTIDDSGRVMRSVIPSFFAYRGTGDATDQNYTDSTKVTFDAERYDNGNCFDLPNSKFIVPVTGLYQINWQVRTSSSASASSIFSPLHLNGSPHWGNDLYLYAGLNDPQAGNNNSPNCAVTIELTADDELEVFIRTTGDSASKVNGAGTFFSGYLIG